MKLLATFCVYSLAITMILIGIISTIIVIKDVIKRKG